MIEHRVQVVILGLGVLDRLKDLDRFVVFALEDGDLAGEVLGLIIEEIARPRRSPGQGFLGLVQRALLDPIGRQLGRGDTSEFTRLCQRFKFGQILGILGQVVSEGQDFAQRGAVFAVLGAVQDLGAGPEHGHADDDHGGDGEFLPPLLDEVDDPSETVDEFIFFEFFLDFAFHGASSRVRITGEFLPYSPPKRKSGPAGPGLPDRFEERPSPISPGPARPGGQ